MSSSFLILSHKLSKIVVGCSFAIWCRRDNTFLLRLKILQTCVKILFSVSILVAAPQRILCRQGAMDVLLYEGRINHCLSSLTSRNADLPL